MGEIGSPDDIPALLALLAPGFIILWFRNKVAEGKSLDFQQQLFYFAVVSAAYYGMMRPLFNIPGGITLDFWLWDILFYFVSPIILGYAVGIITQHDIEYHSALKIGLKLSHRIPSAWDFRFSRLLGGTFVLVMLKDGTPVAGRMSTKSFASSDKDERDVYIEEVWDASEASEWKQVEPQRGILITADEIRWIEVFEAVQ